MARFGKDIIDIFYSKRKIKLNITYYVYVMSRVLRASGCPYKIVQTAQSFKVLHSNIAISRNFTITHTFSRARTILVAFVVKRSSMTGSTCI